MHVFCILLSENHAVMIRYSSQNQMNIEEFKAPFEIKLDKNNRWVKLGESIPWDALARIYYRSMSSDIGAPAIDARIVIGAMIIKHKLKLDDRETMETIRENMYMQYFLGLKKYVNEYVFDPSLFTTLRYQLGADKFDAMTRQIIRRSEKKDAASEKNLNDSDNDMTMNKLGNDIEEFEIKGNQGSDGTGTEDKPAKNKGKLIMDATVADQMIAYPTDLGLLSRSRKESERLIDELCKELDIKNKPRTYRRKARKEYLNLAKKKNKSKKEIRKGIGKQLRYLSRNLKSIDKLLDRTGYMSFPLERREQRIYWVIQHIYSQQAQMYKEHTHNIDNRIVNIYQPYSRPIVRRKDKAQVEFGAKLGVSIQDGYARINTLSWEVYNEGTDLKKQVEAYKKLND